MRRNDTSPRSASAIGAQPSSGALVVNTSNPAAYQTIQAAITAGAASALTVGSVVDIAPGSYTEDDTVPAGVWQLRGFLDWQVTQQDGTIVWSPANGSALTLENFYRLGDGGNTITATLASGTARLFLNQMGIDDGISLTGAGTIHVTGGTSYPAPLLGYVNAVSTTGRIALRGYGLFGNLTTTGAQVITLAGCSFGTVIDVTTAGTSIVVKDCDCTAQVDFIFSGSAGIVDVDGESLSELLANGATVTNGVFRARNGGRTVLATSQTNNIAATDIIADPVTGLYRFDVALIVKTVGTSGTIQPNVIFTDVLGAATVAVGTGLNITGTGRVQGSYVLRAIGPNNIRFSVTGVVTPGTLNYDIEVAATKL
jgi:hypothetical protein